LWNAVARLRKRWKKKNSFKESGSSRIQVGTSIHNIMANDTSHPQSKEIYAESIRLYEQMIVSMEPEQDGASLWIYGPNKYPLVFSFQKWTVKYFYPIRCPQL
jgi:hypothetical protein